MKPSLVLIVFLALSATTLAAPPATPDCSYSRPDCYCTFVWDPVCGTNGCTYGNLCELHCAEAEFAHHGVCRYN